MEKKWDGSVEEEYLQDYKPVSVMGIISFVLGVISAFSIYVPEMWPIGLLALVLSFVTIFRTSSQPATLSWLAYVGAFVAVMAVTWSQTSRSSYEKNLLATADKHAQTWMKMIAEGDVNEAICLRMPYQDRPLEGTDLKEFFLLTDRPDSTMTMMPAPADMKEKFLDAEGVKLLVAGGPSVEIHPRTEKNLITNTSRGVAEISVFYDLDVNFDGRPQTHEVVVHMFRSKMASGVQWQIERMEDKSSPGIRSRIPEVMETGKAK